MPHVEKTANPRRFIYLIVAIAPFLLFGAVRGSVQLATNRILHHYPPPGQMVSVGGHRLHLYCMGAGSPTVVIETGIGTDWTSWQLVSSRLVQRGRVCVYDRAGYGWSEAGPVPRTARQVATELHLLLSNAGIAEPYILIGHSFGGYVARIYAAQFPDSVSGIVLVDPMHEDERSAASRAESTSTPAAGSRNRPIVNDVLALIPPLGITRLVRLYKGEQGLSDETRTWPSSFKYRLVIGSSLAQLVTERNEYDSLSESEAQARATGFPRDIPLTVITALRTLPAPNVAAVEFPPFHRELQAQLAHLSASGKQIIADKSGHMIQIYQPELIVDAVTDAMRQRELKVRIQRRTPDV